MTTPIPLDVTELTRREAEIDGELRAIVARRRAGDRESTAIAIKNAFIKLFGDRHRSRDRVTFFLFVAPRMRRIMMDAEGTGRSTGTINLSTLELQRWLARLEGFDPECVRMIDLRYFAGLSTRETAAVLGLTPQAVIRDLRFAKAWLKARASWNSGDS